MRRMTLDFCVSGLRLDGMQRIEIPMRYSLVSAWIFDLHGSQAVVGVEDTMILGENIRAKTKETRVI